MKTKNYYILTDEKRRQNCKDYINSLPTNGTIEVVIHDYKKQRSNKANRLYWMWLKILAGHIGCCANDLHEQLKVRFLGVDHRIVDDITLVYPKSTVKLTTKEFADYLLKVELLAIDLGVNLPRPDDYNYIMMRE